jgi:hypothetical protein
MDEIHENQMGEIVPYQFEPVVLNENGDISDESGSDSESSQDEEVVDIAFETANCWRLKTLSWCKCGHCSLQTKTIESFCCYEKAIEYDEYDALVANAEGSGKSCITCLSEFTENMLSDAVLKVDICRYLKDNWPLDDQDLERVHKLYRLVAYQRCSRWVFQILGKKRRRPFPSCIYAKIRAKFASPDGLYSHFKYAKVKR